MQVEGPKRRISWIDVAKGLGIIFIVIGHSLKTGWLREYLYSFHVPFFFFLSGITYRYKEEKKNFWNKKIKSIVVPYLVFGLISILIYRVLGEFASDKLGSEISSTRILPNLIGLIYGNSKTGYMRWNLPLWFLTCLITTTLIVDVCETFIINNVKRGRNLYRILIAGCLVVLNYILTQFFHVVLPWHMETACGMSLFFWLGIIDGENHFVQKMVLAIGRNKSMVTAITLIFVGVIVTFFNRGASIREDNYHFYPLYLINAILAGGGYTLLCINIQTNRIMEFLGKRTLSILLMHKFPILVFQIMTPIISGWLKNPDSFQGILSALITTVLSIIMCCIADKVIHRIAPWMLGAFERIKE